MVRRHQTRSKSQEFGEEHMRGWWREKDFSAVLKEQLITCEMDVNSIVAKVYADLLRKNRRCDMILLFDFHLEVMLK